MNEYPYNDYRNYLIHHGIRGQKWGERHGPPYPLDRNVSLEIRKNRVHTHKEVDEDKFYTKKNSNLFTKLPEFERPSQLDKINGSHSIEDDLSQVNPRTGTDKIGSYFNCRNCAVAYELRRRGYDVQARRREDGSNAGFAEKAFRNGKFNVLPNDYASEDVFHIKPMKTQREIDKGWDKLEALNEKAYQDLCKELSKQGNGARGIVVVAWPRDSYDFSKRTSFFHAINYEVGDTVKFYDSQSASENVKKGYGFAYKYVDPRDYSYMRTDNLDLSKDIGKYVVSKSKSDRG